MLSFIKNLFKSEPKATAPTTIWAPPPAPLTQSEPTVTQKQDIVNEQLVKAAKEVKAVEQAVVEKAKQVEQIVEAKVAKIKTRKPRAKKTA